jgi:type II secretory pathway component GspD/PulD (secretin)
LLAADESTNTLVLVADAETRKAVEGLIAKLEQAAEVRADPGMTVADLLTALSKRLDRRFLYSNELGLHLKRVSLQAVPDGAPPAELVGLLESILKSNSLFILPVEGLPGHYSVELAALATKKGLPVLGVEDAVPAGDGMYTKAFKIHGSPRDAQAALINLVTFPQGCVSLENEGLLVVTDYASNLRKCVKVLSQLH